MDYDSDKLSPSLVSFQRELYLEAIKSRTIYHTKSSYKVNVETTSLFPTVKFISDHAIKALIQFGEFPCTLTIMPAALLRKRKKDGRWKYRFFYASYNCTIPSDHQFTIETVDYKHKTMIQDKIEDYDYLTVMQSFAENSKWLFCGILALTYEVRMLF